MSGGLRHHNDEENGPSHAVGHKSSKKEDRYWHRGDHCLCANGKRVPKTTKARSPSPLDMTGAVRDVVKSPSLTMSAVSSTFRAHCGVHSRRSANSLSLMVCAFQSKARS